MSATPGAQADIPESPPAWPRGPGLHALRVHGDGIFGREAEWEPIPSPLDMAAPSSSSNTSSPQLDARQFPVAATSASFFVPRIPSLANSTLLTTYAGSLPARSTSAQDHAHLYFVLIRARHRAEGPRRLIIWLNGGPGCSSFDGSMMEIGAWRLDGKGGLEWTTPGGAWNEYADVLFLDQPVGTGFSYVSTGSYTHSLPQAADEVVYFLNKFVDTFPEFKRGNGAHVYLAGESFAGQYIPYTANALQKAGNRSPVDLQGIAIGNGFIDPKTQYGTELEMMVASKKWSTDSNEYKESKKVVDACRKVIDETPGYQRSYPRCDAILSNIVHLSTSSVSGKSWCINIYDVRLVDTVPACGMNWPPTVKPMYDYLHRKDVRTALHVNEQDKPEAWIECNHRVGGALTDQHTTQAAVTLLPGLLESGLEVLLFAGDQDLICNHIGVQRTAERLEWSGATGFRAEAKEQEWWVNGTRAGTWRTDRGLSYVRVAGASHMVGFDTPVQAHDMMLRFMKVDLLGAAGPSARISSRVGSEPDRLLVIGGGGGGTKDERPMIPGLDGKTEAQVKEEAQWAAYYNAGSAALVVLLILVGVGTYLLLRARRKTRLLLGGHNGLGGLGAGARGRRRRGGLGDDAIGEDEHELEALVEEGADEGDIEEYAASGSSETVMPARQGQSRAGGGGAAGPADGVGRRDQQVIFDVGEDDEEEQEEHRH